MTRIRLGPILAKMLTGESVIRDFATVAVQNNVNEKVNIRAGRTNIDVSGGQWLLSLDPRIIGIWRSPGEPWGQYAGYTAEFQLAGKTLATLDLEPFRQIHDTTGTLHLLKITHSRIRQISTVTAKILYERFYKKPGVDFERLKAVAAAYTYPRRVRIISFQDGPEYHYIFPMDLLGDIAGAGGDPAAMRNGGRYLLGMRHSNQVLQKIVRGGKIVVSEVPADRKSMIYSLGRQHSASPPAIDQLPFHVRRTADFGFYIPDWAESYKEIRLLQTLDLGSHMLLFGEWSESRVLRPDTPHLHHIHFLHFLYLKRHASEPYPVVG